MFCKYCFKYKATTDGSEVGWLPYSFEYTPETPAQLVAHALKLYQVEPFTCVSVCQDAVFLELQLQQGGMESGFTKQVIMSTAVVGSLQRG